MRSVISAILIMLASAALIAGGWLWTPDKSRAELEELYLAEPGDIEMVAGNAMHVRDRGDGDGLLPVILIHGFGSSLHTYEDWIPVLAQSRRVIAFDLPGSGLSGPDLNDDYSDVRAMELITALLDARSIERAHIVGNSIGGRLAWRMAAAHPERVARIVLISPDGFASQGFEYGRAPDVPLILQAMRYALPKAMLRQNIEPAYADPKALREPVMDRYYDLMLAPGSRDALLSRLGQTILVQPEPLLAQIKAPVLLLWGEQDAMIPVGNAQDYLAHLSDARLVALSALGHVPQEEAPERSLEPVLEFLVD